jgi:hypothetical protein
MICATVTTAAGADSLFNLIAAATAGQLDERDTGRVAEVHIQWLSGTFHHVYKAGAVVVATDSGFEFTDPAVAPHQGIQVLRGAAGMNVISLKDIYLGGGVGSARITAYVI